MAKDQVKAADGTVSAEANKLERFKRIETDRFMFNANKGCTKPLVGYLINMIPMTPIKGREWEAFVIKTTEPTLALNRDKELIEVSAGSEVLIPATHQLAQHFERAVAQPTIVFEVYIRPTKKIPVGGGQEMWMYDLRANPNGVLRKNFGVGAMISQPQAPMLPSKGHDMAEAADDIPF
jgi:hypothetical protein